MKMLCLIGFVCVATLAASAPAADPTTRASREEYLRIADEIDANLQREILDRFFPATVDEQGGGFFENYGVDWTRLPGQAKSIVYQSRLTWTSAQAARQVPAKAEMYLAMTRRGATCLANTMWDKQAGGFFWSVNEPGKPGNPIKQIYGHAFGIYALAASYQATHDPEALKLARRGFLWLEEHAHDNENLGYFENVGPDGKPVMSGTNSVGARASQKSMNTSIHILEALASLYRVWPDPRVKLRLQEMLDLCRGKIYSEPGYLTQFLSQDWKRTTSPDSFGHDVEAGYLFIEAAEALDQGTDPQNWMMARRLLDHAVQYGWDKERGGLYDSGQLNADGVVTGGLRTDKIWWVQAEHLNALLLQHDHAGKETDAYWNAFVKQWEWITTNQIDKKFGGWWPTVRTDGAPASRIKVDMWTECYHQARAMFNVSQRLRRIAAERK